MQLATNGRREAAWIHVHHTVVKEFAYVFEIPADKLDDMPGLIVHKLEHITNGYTPSEAQFHTVFKAREKEFKAEGRDFTLKSTLLDLHQRAYEDWGGAAGLKIWAVAEDWLVRNGYTP